MRSALSGGGRCSDRVHPRSSAAELSKGVYVIRQLGGRALGVYVSQALKKGVRYLTSRGVYVIALKIGLKKGVRYLS